MVVPNLKMELAKSTSSLKATLKAVESFKEKMCQDNLAVEKALRVEIEVGKVELSKVKSKLKKRKEHSLLRWRSVSLLCFT